MMTLLAHADPHLHIHPETAVACLAIVAAVLVLTIARAWRSSR